MKLKKLFTAILISVCLTNVFAQNQPQPSMDQKQTKKKHIIDTSDDQIQIPDEASSNPLLNCKKKHQCRICDYDEILST